MTPGTRRRTLVRRLRSIPLLLLLAALTACAGGGSSDVCEQGTVGPCHDTNELQTYFPQP